MGRLVFVHGSVRNGEAAWAAQRALADRYELVALNRPGYPPNPPEARIDFEEQASWFAERLKPGDHLCGHSYGGVVSLYAAGLFPELASLTVLEPPAFGLAAGDPPRTSSPGDSPHTGSRAIRILVTSCSASMRSRRPRGRGSRSPQRRTGSGRPSADGRALSVGS